MKNCFRGFLSRNRQKFRFVGFQYLVAASTALRALVLAWLLPPEIYGPVFFAVSLVGLLKLSRAGVHSGFTFSYFNEKDRSTLEADYAVGSVVYGCCLAVVALSASVMVDIIGYRLALALFLIQYPWFQFEIVLRVKRRFALASSNALLINVLSLAATMLLLFARGGAESVTVRDIGYTFIVAYLLANVALFALSLRQFGDTGSRLRKVGREYLGSPFVTALNRVRTSQLALLRSGFPLFYGTLAYTALTFVDRLFIERTQPAATLGAYMLAWQFVSLLAVGLGAINIYQTVQIGEQHRSATLNRRDLWHALAASSVFGVGAYVGSVCAALLLERGVLERYDGLTRITAVMGIGHMAFGIQGAVSGVNFFSRRQRPLNVVLSIALLLAVAYNLALASSPFSIIWLPALNSVLLMAYSLVALVQVFRCVPRAVST